LSARLVPLLVCAATALGCAPPPKTPALDDMDRVRAASGAQEGAALAPEAFAHAEQERSLAIQLHSTGDEEGAELHANRAMAAYAHALAIARLAHATAEVTDAEKAFSDANVKEQALEASRAKLEQDAQDLEKRVHIAEERLLPALSGKAAADREAARLVAARSLFMEARLLCDAARLVAPDSIGLSDIEGDVSKLDASLSKGAHPAPIDDAARARARCLDVLTRARRGGDQTGAADALLSELSAAGGWSPSRDERGVVIVLGEAFHGAELTADVAGKLKELGHVAAAHAGFAVEVVVHDAQAHPAKDTTDAKRAEAAVQALVAGGATMTKVKSELAGTMEPLVDPSDAKGRARNERLEVTFVSPGK
jgi:hypothetical protein